MKAAPLSAVIMIGPCGLPVTWVGIADASITLSPVREKQVYIILTHFDSQSLSLTTYLLSIERHWMMVKRDSECYHYPFLPSSNHQSKVNVRAVDVS